MLNPIKTIVVRCFYHSRYVKYFNTLDNMHLKSNNLLITKIGTVRKYSISSQAKEIDLDSVVKGDKETEHKLKVLMLELELMRQEGKLVPENNQIKTDQWSELLNKSSRSSRRKYLEFLFKNIKRKEHILQKKLDKRSEPIRRKPKDLPFEEFVQTRDLQHNNIFLRIYDSTINQLYNNKLVQAMRFGQKLIIDCGYHNKMTSRENINCAKQLTLAFSENRVHDDPYDLHFVNCDFQSTLFKSLHKNIGTLYEPWFPINLDEASYLDKFPKNNLVYLTPHCNEEMKEYDHEALYIVGAIVDKMNQEPLSLAKAKKENIKMLKFPLDKYLLWGSGPGKSLTLNQVVSIMLDMKLTGDWNYAFRHVPKRKLLDFNQVSENTQLFTNKTRGKNIRPVANYEGLIYNNKSKFNKRHPPITGRNKISISKLYEE